MADRFVEAFREGIEAAKHVDVAKKEIREVFEEVNERLREASEGRVKLVIKPFPERFDLTTLMDVDQLESPGIPEGQLQRKYMGIGAENPTVGKGRAMAIAKWEQDKRGYPCKIIWENEYRFCEDKEGLRTGLEDLLRDPLTGDVLDRVMRQQPQDKAA